jgi:endonuclease III
MATDPNSMMFGALALGGMGLVFVALRNVRAEVKTMVLESDDFRASVRKVISETCTAHASNSEVAALGAEVRLLKKIAKLPETTAIPRSEVHP